MLLSYFTCYSSINDVNSRKTSTNKLSLLLTNIITVKVSLHQSDPRSLWRAEYIIMSEHCSVLLCYSSIDKLNNSSKLTPPVNYQ